MNALEARAPRNVLVVAMANKLARIAWAVLSTGEDYRPGGTASARMPEGNADRAQGLGHRLRATVERRPCLRCNQASTKSASEQ
jgi:hypothetical protein